MRTPVFRRGVEQFDDFVRDLGEVYGAEPRRAIVRLDLRDARERGKHAQDAVEVGYGVGDQRLVLVALTRPAISLLQPSPHPREWGPQIVRDVVSRLLDFA